MKTISFRVSDSEALRLRAQAKEAGTTLSQFLRKALQGEISANSNPVFTICRHTGALIFAPRPELPTLSSSYVRELLADFP